MNVALLGLALPAESPPWANAARYTPDGRRIPTDEEIDRLHDAKEQADIDARNEIALYRLGKRRHAEMLRRRGEVLGCLRRDEPRAYNEAIRRLTGGDGRSVFEQVSGNGGNDGTP